MDDFLVYIEKLELIAFFAAYALVYLFIIILATELKLEKSNWIKKLPSLLPKSYGLVVLLYVGMKLNQYYPLLKNYSLNFNFTTPLFYLKCWAVIGLIFLFNFFKKKPKLAIFHSLVFLLIPVVDFVHFYFNQIGIEIVHNEMRMFFIGILLHLVCIGIVAMYYYFHFKFLKK